MIEHAIILTQNTVLHVGLPELKRPAIPLPSTLKALGDVERAQIIQTLNSANRIIGG
jgi:hypothetical protein